MGRAVVGVILLLLLPALLTGAEAASPERRLVSLEGAVPRAGELLGAARVVDSFPFAGVVLVEGAPRALAELARLPGVAGVYREEGITLAMERERGIVRAEAPPGSSWPRGEGVTVALVDSGIDATHPAFEGRLAASVRISKNGATSASEGDPDGHGTHVAGIVAGDGARSVDGREHGVAPAARLVGVDISDAFTTTSAVRAFQWIHEHRGEHGIRVVSNSWGREKEDAHYDADDPVIRASDALVASGIVVVFSAGNRGREGAATLTTEAMNPNVITVGAASSSGRVEPYSSRGPARDGDGDALSWLKPDLSAPGTAILSTRASVNAPSNPRTDEERYYTSMNGTSMAAPQVAGAAAIILSVNPDLTPAMVHSILTGTARDLGAEGPDSETGAGMLDVASAIEAARVADGGERRVLTERRIDVSQEGTVVAAERLVVLNGNAPSLPPQESVVLPLVLPPGAAEAQLWFNWSGRGSFEARLVGSSGASYAFERAGEGSLQLRRAAGEGAYRVEARPTGVAAYTPFELGGSILVREEKVVDVPSEFHSRSAFQPQGGFFTSQSAGDRIFGVLAAAPAMVLALVGAGVCSLAVAWRRR